MIRIHDVSKSFDGGKTLVVRGVNLDIPSGEWLVLLGSSGSGKSTLLKMINRLVVGFGGRIEVDGNDIGGIDHVALRRSIGYVSQGIGLFPHWTVEQNVAAVPRLLGASSLRQRERSHELLKLMELDPSLYAGRFPSQLSGGQRQRVGVARALAGEPGYLLMDEPFGALDGVTRDALQQRMLELKRSLGKTVLFVTHDLFEAMTIADRIAVMHEGALAQVGTPSELLHAPATPFVKDLFRKPLGQLQRLGAKI